MLHLAFTARRLYCTTSGIVTSNVNRQLVFCPKSPRSVMEAGLPDSSQPLAPSDHRSEGFLAIAPDALSPLGGTPEDVDRARSMIQALDSEETIENFVAAVQYLETHPLSTGKVGCTGFCWGGGMTNQVAVHAPGLAAAVPYYGAQPDAEDVPKIQAAMLLHYAGSDARINAGIPAFEEALKQAGVEYEIYIYEGAQHAFNNDTNTARYDKEAAELAWQRTIAFFKAKLE